MKISEIRYKFCATNSDTHHNQMFEARVIECYMQDHTYIYLSFGVKKKQDKKTPCVQVHSMVYYTPKPSGDYGMPTQIGLNKMSIFIVLPYI